jgi:hypothetical protein
MELGAEGAKSGPAVGADDAEDGEEDGAAEAEAEGDAEGALVSEVVDGAAWQAARARVNDSSERARGKAHRRPQAQRRVKAEGSRRRERCHLGTASVGAPGESIVALLLQPVTRHNAEEVLRVERLNAHDAAPRQRRVDGSPRRGHMEMTCVRRFRVPWVGRS